MGDPKTCWRCKTKEGIINIHHINGDPTHEALWNKVNLCQKCHDFVQGICDNCLTQKDCSIKKFQVCWAFETAFPPIFYRGIKGNLSQLQEGKEVSKDENLTPLKPLNNIPIIPLTYEGSTKEKDRCSLCKKPYQWKLSRGMVEFICPSCVIILTGNVNIRREIYKVLDITI